MRSGVTEVEAKFHVGRLHDVELRVLACGGRLVSPRIHETNIRFDTPEGQLRCTRRALRLRRDSVVTLTFKGPGNLTAGVRSRPELEVQVDDLDATRLILEGLGYVPVFSYEKYRTTYELDDVEIMLDELPYGDFVELEGNTDGLKPAARRLGLRWDASIPESYHGLFEQLRAALDLPFRDLAFDNFARITARIDDLGIAAADSEPPLDSKPAQP